MRTEVSATVACAKCEECEAEESPVRDGCESEEPAERATRQRLEAERSLKEWLSAAKAELQREQEKETVLKEKDARDKAARQIQAAWRAQKPPVEATSIERRWSKRNGQLAAHVRYLQWLVRQTNRVRPGCWKPGGGLRMAMWVATVFGRKRRRPRCEYGRNNALPPEFAAQAEFARRVLDWYGQYPKVLKRIESGKPLGAVVAFCGEGGSAEGQRRAGASVVGIDSRWKEQFVRRFGGTAFEQGDATCRELLRRLRDDAGARYGQFSPPCKFYSSLLTGEATEPPLIGVTRNLAASLFDYYCIENVMGAAWALNATSVELDGALFGLEVLRARLFEANFPIIVDRFLSEKAEKLRARMCLGARRRWKPLDEFGRPEAPCCKGNIYCVVGKHPLHCTLHECSRAMGMDAGHMTYDGLAQSIPAVYEQLIFSQMCMWRAHTEYGAPLWTFDAAVADWGRACREMRLWLRGAGDDSPSAGTALMPALAVEAVAARRAAMAQWAPQGGGNRGEAELKESAAAERVSTKHAETQSLGAGPKGAPAGDCAKAVSEHAFRELYHSHAGDYGQVVAESSRLEWLRAAGGRGVLGAVGSLESWKGLNTYWELSAESEHDTVAAAWAHAQAAVEAGGVGTRVTLLAPEHETKWLQRQGAEHLECLAYGARAIELLQGTGLRAWTVGRRRGASKKCFLDHEAVSHAMDWRDQYKDKPTAWEKATLTWTRMPHDPERWKGMGLPDYLEEMMAEGCDIELAAQGGAYELNQYPWESGGMYMKGAIECDRALEVGAMEPVPADEVTEAMARNVVHPWLVVDQGGGKFRACHDYKKGTNVTARSAHFGLPTAFETLKTMKPDTHFVKYDMRDGFWAFPIRRESRNRLLMRHPVTKQLLRCARLPFGYVDSPRKFCALTESIADLWRKRVQDGWVIDGVTQYAHILAFVDDFLIQGDCKEAARRGAAEFEKLIEELGLVWAPHKQRGPCRCIEFLGLLLCNVEGHRCISLPADKQKKTESLVEAWLSRRPAVGETADAEPKEVASLLGKLVFAAQVVPGGRTYMQGMMAQFSGIEVDWARGRVAVKGGSWGKMSLKAGFWRDLEWWHDNLKTRNCMQMAQREKSLAAVQTAVLAGTDASDFGSGQTLWIDGQRSEARVVFTEAERSRPINWRELRGIVHVVEEHGPVLVGMKLMLETDNMAAKGAADKRASTAEAMQELLRRLLEACERYDIDLKITHTPGIKLDRPDQTSRGDAVEETRVRVREREFETLARRFGPFTDLLGGERWHEAASSAGLTETQSKRAWLHPAHTTVGSALRLAMEEVRRDATASGVVVVPHDERAGWWSMTRHFAVVGRMARGSAHLEACLQGNWEGMRAARPSLILAYPRPSGARMKPVLIPRAKEDKVDSSGYVVEVTSGESMFTLPLMPGELVYAPNGSQRGAGAWKKTRPQTPGDLYVVADWFNPTRVDDGREPYLDVGAEVTAFWPNDGCWYDAVVAAVSADPLSLKGVEKKYDVDFMDGDSRSDVKAFELRAELTTVMGEGWIRPDAKEKGPWVPLLWAAPDEAGTLTVSDELTWEKASDLWTVGSMAKEVEGPARGVHDGGYDLTGRRFAFDWREASLDVRRTAELIGSGGSVTWAPEPTEQQPDEAEGYEADDADDLAADLKAAAQSADEVEDIHESSRRKAKEGVAKARLQAERERMAKEIEESDPMVRARQQCQTQGAKCGGCNRLLAVGTFMTPVGTGMAHDNKACKKEAEAKLQVAVAKAKEKKQREEEAKEGGTVSVLAKKEGVTTTRRLNETEARTSKERCMKAVDCLMGLCGCKGIKMQCATCHAGLHLVECMGVGKAYAALGRLQCVICRMRKMGVVSCAATDQMVLRETGNMLMELESGAVGTASNAARLVALMEEWCHHEYGEDFSLWPAKAVKMPMHVEEAAVSFFRWMAHEKGHVTSVRQMQRTMGSISGGKDVARSVRVERCLSQLETSTGAKAQPRTQMTGVLLGLVYGEVLPSLVKSKSQLLRDLVALDFEGVGGQRVGEATGPRHGVLANNCVIAKAIDSKLLAGGKLGDDYEWIDCEILDSKTKLGRVVCMAGITRGSGIQVAEHLRGLWRESGLKIDTKTRGGCVVLQPDYWVVRVSLTPMTKKQVQMLLDGKSKKAGAMPSGMDTAVIKKYVKMKMKMTQGSSDDRYVNVAGGAKEGPEVKKALQWLAAAGLSHAAAVEPGPLLRATHGQRWTHMPWATGSTYAQIVRAMRVAYELSVKRGLLDADLELGKRGKPAFGNHSMRRYSDKCAQRYKAKTLGELLGKNADEMKMMINYFYGWKLTELIKEMQMWYAGKDIIDRAETAMVTLMM